MASFPSCNNASYVTNLYESNGDYLYKGQVLASSSCEYLLRAESKSLKLYSTPERSSLYTWYMYDTIWSLSGSSHTESRTLSLSNTGCLTWSYDNSIIKEFCDTKYKLTTTTSSANGDVLVTDSFSDSTHHGAILAIWIPLSVCIFATLLGLAFLVALIIKSNMFRLLYNKISANTAPETVSKQTEPTNTKHTHTHMHGISDRVTMTHLRPVSNMDAGVVQCPSGTDDCMSGSEGIDAPDFVVQV